MFIILNVSTKNISKYLLWVPFCKDNEKYDVIDDIKKTLKIKKLKEKNIKIEGQEIIEILTVNGIRFTFKDGS